MTHLFDIPNEILFKIVESLDLRALRTLICTSRSLNELAIPILIDQSYPELKSDDTLKITSVSGYTTYPLRTAFCLHPLRVRNVSLNIVTSHSNLAKSIRNVASVLARLGPGVEKARISFAVSSWGAQTRVKQEMDKALWIQEIFGVLEMLLDQGCETLEVDGFRDDLRVVRIPGHPNHFVDSWMGALSRALPGRSARRDRAWEPRASGTKVVSLHYSDCLFQPFILGHTVSFLNSSLLQHLKLNSRTMLTEDWHLVLTTLSLSNLQHCELGARRAENTDMSSTSKTIDPVDIFYFLGRHPTIRIFQLIREVSEDIRFRAGFLSTRMKLEHKEVLLPNIEDIRGSVRFVTSVLQRNQGSGAFPFLKSIHVESGFQMKTTTVQTGIANMRQCLALICAMREAGGLQALVALGMDSQTYGSSSQFTVLDLLVSPGNILSSNPTLHFPFIRSVTLATSDWANTTASEYTDEETKGVFGAVNTLFPNARDLHFGWMRNGVWASLKWEGMRLAVTKICPVLERVHSTWAVGVMKGTRVLELGPPRQ